MKKRRVIVDPAAKADLAIIEDWITENAGTTIAARFTQKVLAFCKGLETGSERGTERDETMKGLRLIGFGKRITIAFTVQPENVTVLRIFYGGRNWQADFKTEET